MHNRYFTQLSQESRCSTKYKPLWNVPLSHGQPNMQKSLSRHCIPKHHLPRRNIPRREFFFRTKRVLKSFLNSQFLCAIWCLSYLLRVTPVFGCTVCIWSIFWMNVIKRWQVWAFSSFYFLPVAKNTGSHCKWHELISKSLLCFFLKVLLFGLETSTSLLWFLCCLFLGHVL